MEAYLQIFYIVMGFYGWSQFEGNTELVVRTWKSSQHIKVISSVLIMTLISGWALKEYTNAALPFLDGLTTWGAIVATYMVAKRLLENWIYWFVIDSISIFLFLSRDLNLTALLFSGYLVIIYFGYRSWNREKLKIKKRATINKTGALFSSSDQKRSRFITLFQALGKIINKFLLRIITCIDFSKSSEL